MMLAACTTSDAQPNTDSESASSESGGGGCVPPDESGTPVMLRVRNAGADPIFLALPGCGPGVGLARDGAGVAWLFPDCGDPACAQVEEGECTVQCDGACAAGVLRIAPGGSYEQLWPGTTYTAAVQPSECVGADDCAPECTRAVAAEAGTYQLTAQVYDSCPLLDGASCDCPGGEQPSCGVFSSIDAGVLPQPAAVSFEVPSQTEVELVVGQ